MTSKKEQDLQQQLLFKMDWKDTELRALASHMLQAVFGVEVRMKKENTAGMMYIKAEPGPHYFHKGPSEV